MVDGGCSAVDLTGLTLMSMPQAKRARNEVVSRSASRTSCECNCGMVDISDEFNTWPVSYVGEVGIPESL